MQPQKLKKIAKILLIILFFMPLIAAVMLLIGSSADTRQYAGLNWLLIVVYNIPFLIISWVNYLLGLNAYEKSKERAGAIFTIVSIVSSVIGIVIMFLWGLSNFPL